MGLILQPCAKPAFPVAFHNQSLFAVQSRAGHLRLVAPADFLAWSGGVLLQVTELAARQRAGVYAKFTEGSRVQPGGPLLQLVHCVEEVQQGAPGGRLLRQHPVQIRPQQLAEHPAAAPTTSRSRMMTQLLPCQGSGRWHQSCEH